MWSERRMLGMLRNKRKRRSMLRGMRTMRGMTVPDRCRLIDRTGARHRRALDQLLGMRRTVSRVGCDHRRLPVDLHLLRPVLRRRRGDRGSFDRLTPRGTGALAGGLGGGRFGGSGIVPTAPRAW
jgi:hypothetical protein